MTIDLPTHYAGILKSYSGRRSDAMVQAINQYHDITGDTAPADLETLESLADDWEREQPSEMAKGFNSGLQGLQAMSYGAVGLLGKAAGPDLLSDKVRDWGYEGYKRNMAEAAEAAPSVASVSEIDTLDSAADWALGTIGQLAPSIIEAAVSVMAGGGIAGLAGKSVLKNRVKSQIGKEAEKLIAKGIAKEIAEEEAKKIVTSTIIQAGKNAGLVGGVGAIEAGSNFGEAADEVGVENVNTLVAGGAGLASGLTELVSPTGLLLRRLGPGMPTDAAKRLPSWSARGLEIPKSMAEEGLQEVTQQGLSDVSKLYHNPDAEISGDEYLNSFSAGAVGGGFPAGVNMGLSLIGRPKATPTETNTSKPLADTSTDIVNAARGDINQQTAEKINRTEEPTTTRLSDIMRGVSDGEPTAHVSDMIRSIKNPVRDVGIGHRGLILEPGDAVQTGLDPVRPYWGEQARGLQRPELTQATPEEIQASIVQDDIAAEEQAMAGYREMNDPAYLARVENQRRMDEGTVDIMGGDHRLIDSRNRIGGPDSHGLQSTGNTVQGVEGNRPESQGSIGGELPEIQSGALGGTSEKLGNTSRRTPQSMADDEAIRITDPGQLQFIQNKVSQLGSVESVDKFYDGTDNVSKYAREYARSVFTDSRQVGETGKTPKQNEIPKSEQPKSAKIYPEGVRLTSKGNPYRKRGAQNAAALHTKKTGEQTEIVELGKNEWGWRVVPRDEAVSNQRNFAPVDVNETRNGEPQTGLPLTGESQTERILDESGRVSDGRGGISPGDVFKTSSGRKTTPYPRQKSQKHASAWLIENAVMEAESRGDKWNANIFKGTTTLKDGSLTVADGESLNMYLFGEQPKVPRQSLKPLETQSTTDQAESVRPETDGAMLGDGPETRRGARKATEGGAARIEKAQGQLRDIINNPDIVGRQRADRIANGKNLVQFLEAYADNDLETDHHRGDLVAYTGEDAPNGFRSIIYLEGDKAGKYDVKATPEAVEENAKRNKKEWEDQQAGFRRLRESTTHQLKKESDPGDIAQSRDGKGVSDQIKEPWQMTRSEYEKINGKPRKGATSYSENTFHKNQVGAALNQGKPVPAEVLKDYPELTKTEPPTLPKEQRTQDNPGDMADSGARPLEIKEGYFVKRKRPDGRPASWEKVVSVVEDGFYTDEIRAKNNFSDATDIRTGNPILGRGEVVFKDGEPIQKQNDRRKDTARRKAVSEMSHEEMKRELLTDYLTGLGNKRAYEESPKKKHQVSIDADALKWVNDNLGHPAGDKLLKMIGKALKQEGLEAYHISGDEYYIQGDDADFLENSVKKAYDYLKSNPIKVTLPDGTKALFTGGFSYGRGQSIEEAEIRLHEHKTQRELSGERSVRGQEPTGSIKRLSEGNEDRDRRGDVHDLEAAKDSDLPPGVSKNDIPYNLAYDAHRGSSFTPEKRAVSEQNEYVGHLTHYYDKWSKLANTDEKKEILSTEFTRYRDGYLSKTKALLSANSRTMSSMITGLSNFPTRSNQKKLDTAHKRLTELLEWSKKAQRAIERKLTDSEAIKTEDPDAVKKLKAKLESAEKAQETMKAANKIVRNKRLSDEEKIAELEKTGLSEKQAKEILKPDFAGRVGFASYALTNNNADIRRLKQRIEDVSKKQSDEQTEIEFDGGSIIDNPDANRVQIFFEGKPEEDVRKKLKSSGFRWAPSAGAWQRHRSNVALRLAKEITGAEDTKLSKSESTPTKKADISELTPKQRRTLTALTRNGKVQIVTAEEAEGILKSSGDPKFMVAYHGTPHDFDKFTIDKIGTGEGAQAYGYGLYFAGKKAVADWYKEILSGRANPRPDRILVDGKKITEEYADALKEIPQLGKAKALKALYFNKDVQKAIDIVSKIKEESKGTNSYRNYGPAMDFLISIKGKEITIDPKGAGKLYEVELAPSEDEYLLWDGLIDEQSEKVAKALKNSEYWEYAEDRLWDRADRRGENPTGRDIYKDLLEDYDPKEASEFLKSLGIRGIKYLDGTSRRKGEGSYNYVIFDDADVKIIEKYSKNGQVQGFFLNSKAYVIPENVESGKLWSVVRHEVGVHMGQLLQDNKGFDRLKRAFEARHKENSPTGEAIRKAFDKVPEDTKAEHVTEEAMAYLVEGSPEVGFAKRILNFLKRVLVKLGVSESIFTADDFVAMADAALRKEARTTKTGVNQFAQDAKMSLSKAKRTIQNLPAFKKWFGDSKVVDVDGEPLVVYHGTKNGDFSEFDPSKKGSSTFHKPDEVGFHFTTDINDANVYAGRYAKPREGWPKGSRVVEAFVSVANPYKKTGSGTILKSDIDRAINGGYDGIIVDGGAHGHKEIVVFKPNQIKSIFNSEWNPENPDIMFSKSQGHKKESGAKTLEEHVKSFNEDTLSALDFAGQFIGDAKTVTKGLWKDRNYKHHSEKKDVAWLEKSFDLVSHYAKKIPAFRRAYEHALRNSEIKTMIEQELTHGVDENGNAEKFVETFKAFRKKFKEEYGNLSKYLDDTDRRQVFWNVEELPAEDLPEGWTIGYVVIDSKGKKTSHTFKDDDSAWEKVYALESEAYVDRGGSYEGARALKRFRTINDRAYKMRVKGIEEIRAHCQKHDIPEPAIAEYVDGKTVHVDLKTALAEMGSHRGYYMPRIRKQGDWMVWAEKEGESPMLVMHDFKAMAIGHKALLEKDGYQVTVKQSNRLSEDLYANLGSVLAQQAAINKSLEHIERGNKTLNLDDLNITGEWEKGDYVVAGEILPEYGDALVSIGAVKRKKTKILKSGGTRFWVEYRFEDADKEIEEKAKDLIFKTKGVVPDIAFQIAEAMASQYADILRMRGSRSAMIARKYNYKPKPTRDGKFSVVYGANEKPTGYEYDTLAEAISKAGDLNRQGVVRGYEEDAITRVTRSAYSLAGGEAKKKTALAMIRAITGHDIEWAQYKEIKEFDGDYPEYESYLADNNLDYVDRDAFDAIREGEDEKPDYETYLSFVKDRSIDPAKQKTAHAESMALFQDIMRNEERVDRVIGTLKGLAVIKYLGFRVAAPVVNVTNMVVGVPATMNGYGKIPLRNIHKLIGTAYTDYYRFKKGTLENDDMGRVFQEIEKRGWDQAYFNQEAVSVLQGRVGYTMRKAIDMSMTLFSWSEKLNRVASISAAYKGLIKSKPELTFEERMRLAKEISDKAHGVYEKANRPSAMRGSGIGANAMQTAYVFKTFSHNFMATMFDLGFREKEAKAALWMAFSPVIFGVGSSVGAKVLISAIGKAMGSDDPEEDFYRAIESNFGTGYGDVARFGIPGLAGHGVSLKGSLSIGIADLPTSFKDLAGAPGSVLVDIYEGLGDMAKGNVSKGSEKILPLAFGAPIKAIREASEGITTRSNAPVMYNDSPLKADSIDAFLRFFSFNPARIAGARERLWADRKKQYTFQDMRSEIYARLKKYHLGKVKNTGDLKDIELMITAYNSKAKKSGQSLITRRSIKSVLKRAKVE